MERMLFAVREREWGVCRAGLVPELWWLAALPVDVRERRFCTTRYLRRCHRVVALVRSDRWRRLLWQIGFEEQLCAVGDLICRMDVQALAHAIYNEAGQGLDR